MKRQGSPRKGTGLSRPGRSSPACRFIVGALLLAWLADCIWDGGLSRSVGLLPERVLRGEVWRILGFTLVHCQTWQLVANVLILWIIARRIEERWGTRRFLGLCLACSLATAAVATAAHIGKTPYLGASGMVLGLVLAYASTFGRRRPIAGLPATQLAGAMALIAAIAAFQPKPLTAAWGAAGAGVLAAATWIALEPRAARWRVARRRRSRIREQCRIAEMRQVVDRILDKINSDGMQSLTRQERSTLHRASRLFAGQRTQPIP